MNQAAISRTIDAAYDSVLADDGWAGLLGALAGLFRCHFADLFARTTDRSRFHGHAFGMDRREYDEIFLGTWMQRNVWANRQPVRVAGEIVTTREIMPREELRRHEMYNEFLAPRDLHEGLRLAISVGDGWVQDVSLLRAWSAGPFGAAEIAVARQVLPHLQRAAAIGRRLGEAGALARAGSAGLDLLRHGVFLLGSDGRVLWHNRAAETLAAEGVVMERGGLRATQPSRVRPLAEILSLATIGRDGVRQAATTRLARPSGAAPLSVLALPIARRNDWTWLNAPAALVLVSGHEPAASPEPAMLAAAFNLTQAEAELAVELLAGRALAEIAASRGRSVNTLRTQLARLMAKTDTNRQSELVRVLLSVPPAPGDWPVF